MSNGFNAFWRRGYGPWAWVGQAALCLALAAPMNGQTASTGALSGVALDPSGGILPDVDVVLVNQDTSETQFATSNNDGLFAFPSLSPGRYELTAKKTDFEPTRVGQINIHVTETLRIELHLQLAKRFERAEVSSNPLMVQTDSSALGRVVNESA